MSVLHGLALGCRLVIPTDTVATGAAAKGQWRRRAWRRRGQGPGPETARLRP